MVYSDLTLNFRQSNCRTSARGHVFSYHFSCPLLLGYPSDFRRTHPDLPPRSDQPLHPGLQSYATGTQTPNDGAWTVSNTGSADRFEVRSRGGSQVFEGDDTDADATWLSELIDVSGYTDLELAIDLEEEDVHESDDFIRVAYVLDGGSAVTLVQLNDDYGTSSQTGLSIPDGSNVRIQVVINTDSNI